VSAIYCYVRNRSILLKRQTHFSEEAEARDEQPSPPRSGQPGRMAVPQSARRSRACAAEHHDLTTGDQPIANEDERIHIVVNGEFYDFERQRRELERRGHLFRTRHK
jgi:Glutamine amidotransferase domain